MGRGRVGVVALWLVGCGGVIDASKGDASNDGGTPVDKEGGLLDVAVDVTPTPPTTDAGAGDAEPLGTLYFEQDTTSGGSHPGMFIALFFPDAQQANQGCTMSASGPCRTYDCPSPPPPTASLSAGTLTIFGGPLGSNGVSVTQNASYTYGFGGALPPGAVMGVSASGGQVPPFGPEAVTMPPMITLTTPAAPFAIVTGSDLTATWANGEVGATVLLEAFANEGGKSIAVACKFDGAAGTGTIPHSLLSQLAGVSGGMLFWGQERDVSFTAGSYPLQLSGLQFAYGQATYP